MAQDAVDAVRDRASLDHLQGSVQPALARSSTSAWCTAPTCAPRSRSTPAPDEIAVCNLGSVNLPAHLDMRRHAGPRQAQAHGRHRDAHARQRHRHQLLRGRQGAQLQLQAPPGRARASWASRTACTCCACPYASPAAVEFADRSMEAVAYYRLLGLDRARRGARAVLDLQGLAVGPRHPAAGHARSCCARSAAATSKCDTSATLDWERAARAHQAGRHAQLQLPRDRAHGDHRQHHRRVAVASSRPTRTCT